MKRAKQSITNLLLAAVQQAIKMYILWDTKTVGGASYVFVRTSFYGILFVVFIYSGLQRLKPGNGYEVTGIVLGAIFLTILSFAINNTMRRLLRIVYGSVDEDAKQMRARIDLGTARSYSVSRSSDAGKSEPEPDDSPARTDDGSQTVLHTLGRQEEIMLEIYTQGLAQASAWFRASIGFAIVGAILLLAGVALAIIKAGPKGYDYASIVSGLAGVVVTVVSGLFFGQSNRARKDSSQQAILLREESKQDRLLNSAIELTNSITDVKLKDNVRADLARTLVGGDGSSTSRQG